MNVFVFPRENDDDKGRGGGGQRVMIGIVIVVNDDNCGRPLSFFSFTCNNMLFPVGTNHLLSIIWSIYFTTGPSTLDVC